MDEDQRFDEAFDEAIVLVGQSRDDTKKEKMINRIRRDRMELHQAIDNRKKRFFDLVRMEKEFKKLVNASDEEIEEYMKKKAELEESFLKDNSKIKSIAKMYNIELKPGVLIGENEDELLGLGVQEDPLKVERNGSSVINYIGAPIVNPSVTGGASQSDEKDKKPEVKEDKKDKDDKDDKEAEKQAKPEQSTQTKPAETKPEQKRAPANQTPASQTTRKEPASQAPAAQTTKRAPASQAPAAQTTRRAPASQEPATQASKKAPAQTRTTSAQQKPAPRAQSSATPTQAKPAPRAQSSAAQAQAKPAPRAQSSATPTQAKPAPRAQSSATPTQAKPAPKAQTPEQNKPVQTVETTSDDKKVVANKKIGREALAFAEVVSDFYSGKLEKTGTLSNADKVFLANNTYKSIKAKYGDKLPDMTEEQEELFDEFIKYISGTRDGYYMNEEERNMFKESSFPTIIANQQLFDKYFKDCKNDDERFEVFKVLNASANLSDEDLEEVRDSHEKFINRMKEHGIEHKPKEEKNAGTTPKKSLNGEEKTASIPKDTSAKPKSEKIIPAPIIIPATSGKKDKDDDDEIEDDSYRPTYVRRNVAPAREDNGIRHRGIILPIFRLGNRFKQNQLKIVVKGTKMYVNGVEYKYNTHSGKDFSIKTIYDDIQQSPIIGGKYFNEQVIDDLIEMKKSLTNGGKDIMLDPNIVYALVNHCKEGIIFDGTDEQRTTSIQKANEKLKKLYFAYEQMANRDLSRKDKSNPLRIEYDLRATKGLEESDRNAIFQMANMSSFYAIIRMGFLRRILDKLFGPKYRALPTRISNLSAGGDSETSGSGASQERQREEFVKDQKAPNTPSQEQKIPSQFNLDGIDVEELNFDDDEPNK